MTERVNRDSNCAFARIDFRNTGRRMRNNGGGRKTAVGEPTGEESNSGGRCSRINCTIAPVFASIRRGDRLARQCRNSWELASRPGSSSSGARKSAEDGTSRGRDISIRWIFNGTHTHVGSRCARVRDYQSVPTRRGRTRRCRRLSV